MISSIGQVMLYVSNVEASADFWRNKVGFERVEKQTQGDYVTYIVAPKLDSEVSFVLHDKAIIAQMSPELDLATPSILFETTDIDSTYQELTANEVMTNPIVDMGSMRVFNFSDNDNNYFAIREVK